MSSKKSSSIKKQMSTERAKPTLTLDVTIQTALELKDNSEFYAWETDGIIYAEMLSSPECPASFREAFRSIFYDHLLEEFDMAHPAYIRAFFPLVLLCLKESRPVDATTAADILRTLRESLAPELVKRIRDSVVAPYLKALKAKGGVGR